MSINDKKLIVVLGPTASGKSELAIKLALRLSSGQAKKMFNINGAEIISADSRQIYKGMDIGTGKVTKKEMRGVPHHLLDVASPKRRFTVTQYRKLALRAIDKIFKKIKIPIICGGTGFYIQAVIDGLIIPEVAPDWKLRKKLEKKSVKELYKMLKKLDPKRAKTIEKENPRRLIRAIEIVMKIGAVPILEKKPLPYPLLIIGIKKDPEELKKLIKKRLLKRIKRGMIKEVEKLHKSGVSWKRLEEFGLEYRWLARYLKSDFQKTPGVDGETPGVKTGKSDFLALLQKDIEHYAKRQMTWFKRDARIHWVKNYKEAVGIVTRPSQV